MNNLTQDLFEEALETGQSLGQQAKQISPVNIAKTAMGQITGSPVKINTEKSAPNQPPAVKQEEIIEQLYGSKKPVDPAQMNKMRLQEAAKKDKGISQTKAELAAMKMKRYQELQQKVLVEEHKREQEIPESEAGRPGAPRNWEEKAALIEKQKKEAAQRQENTVKPPSSSRNTPGLDAMTKPNQGSREVKLGKLG